MSNAKFKNSHVYYTDDFFKIKLLFVFKLFDLSWFFRIKIMIPWHRMRTREKQKFTRPRR